MRHLLLLVCIVVAVVGDADAWTNLWGKKSGKDGDDDKPGLPLLDLADPLPISNIFDKPSKTLKADIDEGLDNVKKAIRPFRKFVGAVGEFDEDEDSTSTDGKKVKRYRYTISCPQECTQDEFIEE